MLREVRVKAALETVVLIEPIAQVLGKPSRDGLGTTFTMHHASRPGSAFAEFLLGLSVQALIRSERA